MSLRQKEKSEMTHQEIKAAALKLSRNGDTGIPAYMTS